MTHIYIAKINSSENTLTLIMHMKKYILVSLLLIIEATAFAQQTNKKTPAKDKPPTQKEVNDMMKEMQEAMDDISPEDKKMMDSMGIKMPDMKKATKDISGISGFPGLP